MVSRSSVCDVGVDVGVRDGVGVGVRRSRFRGCLFAAAVCSQLKVNALVWPFRNVHDFSVVGQVGWRFSALQDVRWEGYRASTSASANVLLVPHPPPQGIFD